MLIGLTPHCGFIIGKTVCKEVINLSETNPKLNEWVNSKSKIYLTIYDHPEYDHKAQRSVEDRLPDLKKIYDDLSAKLQRPLRVLDLGCSYGTFCFHVCSWGGTATGVDIDESNIEICRLLASEHPDFNVNFIQSKFQDFVPTIKDGEYDLVLAFSMLHWVIHQIGFAPTQKLLIDLAKKVPVGLFELAQAKEFPELKLPKNVLEHFKGYFFTRMLKYCDWRKIKNSQRPLYFASNKYVHFDDLGILEIDRIPLNNRKHCQCGDKFIKVIGTSNKNGLEMAQNEIRFLRELGGKNNLPKLHSAFRESDEPDSRLFIIRDNVKGRTIHEKIYQDKEVLDSWNVIEQILQWVIFLEKHGYYQKDWGFSNWLCSDDGKILPIDYGLMVHDPISHRWPLNVRLTFIGFMNSLLAQKGNVQIYVHVKEKLKFYCETHLLTELRQYVSDDKYHRILALNDDEKFFENLYEILFSSPNPSPDPKSPRHRTIAEVEILEKEQYLHDLCFAAMAHEAQIKSLTQMVSQQAKEIEQLKNAVKK